VMTAMQAPATAAAGASDTQAAQAGCPYHGRSEAARQ
jgi:hypothetical protein